MNQSFGIIPFNLPFDLNSAPLPLVAFGCAVAFLLVTTAVVGCVYLLWTVGRCRICGCRRTKRTEDHCYDLETGGERLDVYYTVWRCAKCANLKRMEPSRFAVSP